MMDAFVIAFIHCAAQRCVVSYPRPGELYQSYGECQAQLPQQEAAHRFDLERFEGAEIACVEVPAADDGEWVARETSNLRKGPSVDSEVIGTIRRGAAFRVIGQARKWLNIRTADGTIGFLWADRAEKLQPPPPASAAE